MSPTPNLSGVTPVVNRPRGVLQIMKAYFSSSRIGDLLVLKGRLEPEQLEHALMLARARGQRIGRVLVEERLIRQHELYALLGKQWGVRSLAWGVAMFMSIGSVAPRQVRADEGRSNYYTTNETYAYASGARLAMPETGNIHAPIHSYPALFGSEEKRSDDLTAFVKWTSMFNRYNAQLEMNSTRATLASWKKQITTTQSESIADLARGIDVLMNQVSYVDDRANWGKSDYWETPFEFLKYGGDCEDFAIAKYMSLKALGVSEDRLRIAIVHDLIKNIPHAVLVVYTEEGPLVLDNQSKTTQTAADISRYKPIFSINAKSWWLHTKGADVQVASAAN